MKKVLKILTLIMVIITIIKISDTYSKYYTTANTNNLSKDIGEWIIKVNEMDIYSEDGDAVEFTLENFGNFTNPNTDPTKISPGNKGYTDIVIDPTGTDVAVRYDIELDPYLTNLFNQGNLKVTFEIQTPIENMQFVKINENKYSGVISLADIQANEKITIRCYIDWENNENQNEIVTQAVMDKIRHEFLVPFNIKFTQYLGEPLQ